MDAEALRKLTSNQEMMELMANDKLQVRAWARLMHDGWRRTPVCLTLIDGLYHVPTRNRSS